MKKFILLFFFAFLFVGISKACICEEQTLEERIEKYHFIFIGNVISVEDIFSDSTSTWPDQQRIIIEIEKKFKGNQSEQIIVESELSGCASFFEEGKKYLVFAGHSITNETEVNENFVATNNKVLTGKCYGTRAVEFSKKEIQELENHYNQ